jgi:hypothetical protein
MLPLLRRGDGVLIRSCHLAALKPGDLIALTDGVALYTHRLIRIVRRAGREWLLTKGDGCARWDDPVAPSAIVGKGVAIRRGQREIGLERAHWRVLNGALLIVSVVAGGLLWAKWKLLG